MLLMLLEKRGIINFLLLKNIKLLFQIKLFKLEGQILNLYYTWLFVFLVFSLIQFNFKLKNCINLSIDHFSFILLQKNKIVFFHSFLLNIICRVLILHKYLINKYPNTHEIYFLFYTKISHIPIHLFTSNKI